MKHHSEKSDINSQNNRGKELGNHSKCLFQKHQLHQNQIKKSQVGSKISLFFLFACWLLSFFPFTSLITNLLIPLVILCFFNYPLRLFTAEDDSTNGEVSSLFSGNINTSLGRALSHYLLINCKLIQVIP